MNDNLSMQPLSRYLFPGLVAAFAVVCLYGLRTDIALVSFAPLRARGTWWRWLRCCSLLNYALRIVRWQRYLARLGRRSCLLRFTSLTYLAGFAFTVSPGKVGEMARARYYSRFGISVSGRRRCVLPRAPHGCYRDDCARDA